MKKEIIMANIPTAMILRYNLFKKHTLAKNKT